MAVFTMLFLFVGLMIMTAIFEIPIAIVRKIRSNREKRLFRRRYRIEW